MALDPDRPELQITLTLDQDAPRAARYHVAQLDRPSPDLRDAVVLLTSELVTRAAARAHSPQETVELRAWMPAEVVRVEIEAPPGSLAPTAGRPAPDYGSLLLGQIADRWSQETEHQHSCLWFEIDRHETAGGSADRPLALGAAGR